MKRIILFLATNIAILLVLSVTASILGINQFLSANGLNMGMLLAFSALIGFGGSFISLMMSKTMAKWGTGAKIIERPNNPEEAWLLDTVARLANNAGLPMPEVAMYKGAPNAFATGPGRSNSLVAVSTGLMQSMNHREVEAVLAHELAHIANGDMVTLTLIQGVLNTFVIFLSRVAAFAVDKFMRSDDSESEGPGMTYFLTSIVFQILFGVLAGIIVMYFSRHREYKADASAAVIMGDRQPMINALKALGRLQTGVLPKEMAASGIAGGGISALFSTHPSLESRIEALQAIK
jgi:heat shock protein HtpX